MSSNVSRRVVVASSGGGSGGGSAAPLSGGARCRGRAFIDGAGAFHRFIFELGGSSAEIFENLDEMTIETLLDASGHWEAFLL